MQKIKIKVKDKNFILQNNIYKNKNGYNIKI